MRHTKIRKVSRLGLIAILALGPIGLSRAYADFNLGAAISYAVLGVSGSSTTGTGSVMIGNVGVGSGGTLTLNGSIVDGNVQFQNSVVASGPGTNFTQNGALITGTVSGNVAQVGAAVTAAQTLATYAASQTPTISSLTNLSLSGGSQTISATPGASNTVVNLKNLSLSNATLNISGSASSYFIINIASTLALSNSTINLLGGVTADHVLFDAEGKGSSVTISSGSYAGTFLAMNRYVSFSGGILDGQLLGGGASQVVLTGTVTVDDVSASPAASTAPEPASLVLLGIGGIGTAGMFGWKQWRRRRSQPSSDSQPVA